MYKIIDMLTYYKYIFLLSWPSFVAYLSIIVFLVYRFIFRIKGYRSKDKSINEFLRIGTASLLSVVVICIFGIIFFSQYGEWLERPGYIKGKIEKIDSCSNERICLIIKNENNISELFAGESISEAIHPGDIVELSYIPGKRIIYKCNFLTESTD